MDDTPRRHAVRLTPAALRQIRAGHPWVFDRSIRSGPDHADPGDLAVVFDERRRFVAIGLWDPTSPIRIRILHHGTPAPIDDGFWAARIGDAVAGRRCLLDSDTTGWRVVNGENDHLPGLVADRYGSCLVVKVDTAALLPRLDHLAGLVADGLAAVGVAIDTVVARSSRTVGAPTRLLRGSRPDGPVPFTENGLRFGAEVLLGQKTGHFLDQRDNRALVGSLAAGADVLDVFSCTGGFSVNAAAGGARSVVTVDQSRWALEAAQAHLETNRDRCGRTNHRTVRGDAFEVLAGLGTDRERFDLVVIDPPSFASRTADRDRALASYRRLAALGAALLRPGGQLFQASCSSRIDATELRSAVTEGVVAAGRSWSAEGESGHAVDHPIGFPEGAYLKALWGRLP